MIAEVDVEDQAILYKLERFNTLLYARDPALLNELWSDLGFVMLGSEPQDETHTRAALAARLEDIYALPMRLSFGWSDVTVVRERDVAWAMTDTHLVLTGAEEVTYQPYRVICIFQRAGGRWRWRMLSASALPPPPCS